MYRFKILLIVFGLLISGLVLLGYTPAGFKLTVNYLNRHVPGLTLKARGTLMGPIGIEALH